MVAPERAGEEPRIAPLPPEQWDERLTRVLQGTPGGVAEPMHIFTTLARGPEELFRRWLGFGGALLNGTLPDRLRELVILRTAARVDGRYEWAQHIGIAKGVGVRKDEIEALGDEVGAVEWAPLEEAALRAVDETAADGEISDATWAALSAHLDERERIELLMLIGHYVMLSSVLRSLRVQLELRAEAQAVGVPTGPTR